MPRIRERSFRFLFTSRYIATNPATLELTKKNKLELTNNTQIYKRRKIKGAKLFVSSNGSA
ncbi:MAG TPA: hypothetical protein DCX01_04705 [Bacteroidetes bacterium]|nr:hypothetical protein [Bacteroidota bacterium]